MLAHMRGARRGAPLKAQKGTRPSIICCCTVIASSSSTSYTVGTCGAARAGQPGYAAQRRRRTMIGLPPWFHEALLYFARTHTPRSRRLCRRYD